MYLGLLPTKTLVDHAAADYVYQNALSFRSCFEIVEGWILNSNSERLFWVLPSLQTGLWWPGSGIILGKFITKIDMERFQYGKSWTSCQ